jgi:hypothetical protein
MRARIAIITASAALGAPAGADATVTFGADVQNQPPDFSFFCNTPAPFFINTGFFPNTCTAYSAGEFGTGIGSHEVPDGEGVLTKARVRFPNVSGGPLKFSILRSDRTAGSSLNICCRVVDETTTFIPFPNAITEITFSPPIPVHSIVTSTGVFEIDQVAITATTGSSIIPASQTPTTVSSGGYYPAVQKGQERHESQTSFGLNTEIDFQLDWEPTNTTNATGGSGGGGTGNSSTGGGGTAGNPQPKATSSPPSPIPSPPANVRPITVSGGQLASTGGTATLPIACQLTSACDGLLSLTSGATGTLARAAAKKPRKPVSYGTARFSVPAGQTRAVKVKLNRKGRKLVKRRKAVTVYANTRSNGQTLSSRVTIARGQR